MNGTHSGFGCAAPRPASRDSTQRSKAAVRREGVRRATPPAVPHHEALHQISQRRSNPRRHPLRFQERLPLRRARQQLLFREGGQSPGSKWGRPLTLLQLQRCPFAAEAPSVSATTPFVLCTFQKCGSPIRGASRLRTSPSQGPTCSGCKTELGPAETRP